MQQLTHQLLDRAQPIDARIEAAQLLSRQSSDYDAFSTLCSVIHAEDEEPALRCAALRTLPEWNRFSAIQQLTKPYTNQEVRSAAIETLASLGPVKGSHEVLLSFQLASLRGTVTDDFIASALGSVTPEVQTLLSMEIAMHRSSSDVQRRSFFIDLPQRWGRDPRVLEFLKEELQRGDEQRREDAVASLCVLGELKPALRYVNDPSPMVRARLARVLGSYREQQGLEVLQLLLRDSDPEVVKQAKSSLRLLGRMEMPTPVKQPQRESAWGRLLAGISRLRLTDSEVAVSVPDEKVNLGWLGEPPATEEELATAERRLGTTLPPSYRAFLTEANGFEQLSASIWRLYGTGEIHWFRVLNQDWIDAYQTGDDISPEEHLSQKQNCVAFRSAYLSSCLQISEEGDSAVVLLNPEVVTAAGEWETWFFANWLPGATRYSSFREFMEAELRTLSNADL
jgi:cell wall assembly regulator SMI1